jgi:hypothetical protein
MSLVSIAATSAVFPALTALGHKRDLVGLRTLHDRTQLAIAFVAIPAFDRLVALATGSDGVAAAMSFAHVRAGG